MVVLHHPVERRFKGQILEYLPVQRYARVHIKPANISSLYSIVLEVAVIMSPCSRPQRKPVLYVEAALQIDRTQKGVGCIVNRSHLSRGKLRDPELGTIVNLERLEHRFGPVEAEHVLRQRRLQGQVIHHTSIVLVLLLRAGISVHRSPEVHERPRSINMPVHSTYHVVPAHLLRVAMTDSAFILGNGNERIAVHAAQEGSVKDAALARLPAELSVKVAHSCAEVVKPAQKVREHALDSFVFQRQRRNSSRKHEGHLLVYRGLESNARKEVVQGSTHTELLARRVASGYSQMSCREVRAAAIEASLQERGLGHHILRDDRRQTQKMRISIYWDTVKGYEVVAHIASAHIERCRSVSTGTHARHALSPADRVAFSERRNDPAYALETCTQLSKAFHNPPAVGLHRRCQSVVLFCNLSRDSIWKKQHYCSCHGYQSVHIVICLPIIYKNTIRPWIIINDIPWFHLIISTADLSISVCPLQFVTDRSCENSCSTFYVRVYIVS